MEQSQGKAKLSLVETVSAVLREDIQCRHDQPMQLRQPPINEDDYDSWAFDNGTDGKKWEYVAESIIKTIDRYMSRQG